MNEQVTARTLVRRWIDEDGVCGKPCMEKLIEEIDTYLTSLRSENARLREALSGLDYFVVIGDDPITCVAGYFFEADANAHAMRLIGAKSPRVMERDEWLARQAVAGGGEKEPPPHNCPRCTSRGHKLCGCTVTVDGCGA